SLAASGRKTIILEFDLRNPMIAKNLNIKPGKGLSDFLTREVFIEDIISPTPIHANLFVAVAGSLPEYPTELLQQPSMTELMDWLTINFDEILIDTPPIQLVADAMILSEYSDINLYVVRQGFTNRSQLDYVKQIHSEKRLKNLNIVFNGVDGSKLGSTYAYGYYGSRFANKREAVETGVKDFFKRF
ncbi:MAG TPA: CpsD/CapB family tyrosine-protein kinase, partial [Pedobacter sp.]|uniref:tyrosine-protein kinase family protein n=1 Tax=Pedobacter sp. TaxID=1411316 RepID=UPI002BADD8E0